MSDQTIAAEPHETPLGSVSKPLRLHVDWALTYRCELRCAHCYVPGRAEDPELPLPKLRTIVRQLAALRDGLGCALHVAITGGDPLLCSNLLEVIDGCVRAGFTTSLECNPGRLTAPLFEAMRRSGLGRMQFGLESLRTSLLSAIGRTNGKAALETAEALVGRGITIRLHSTIFARNAADVVSTYRHVAARGIPEFSVARWIPGVSSSTFKELTAHQWRRVLLDLLDAARAGSPGRTLVVCDDPLFGVLLTELGFIAPCDTHQRDDWPWFSRRVAIEPNGLLRLGLRQGEVLGSLMSLDLSELWRGASLLRQLRDSDTFEKCSTCQHRADCCGMAEHAFSDAGRWGAADPLCWHSPEAI